MKPAKPVKTIYLKQRADGEWVFGLEPAQNRTIITWTRKSWPTKTEAEDTARRQFAGFDVQFEKEKQ